MQYGRLGTRREVTLTGMPQNLTNERTTQVRQWLGTIRQQAITWSNVDPDICLHMAWLGQNRLKNFPNPASSFPGTTSYRTFSTGLSTACNGCDMIIVVLLCISAVKQYTVYPKKYAHGFVVLCFVVVMQSFIMNSHEVFIHIHQGCFAGTGAIVRLPQCQWSKPDGYGKISQCITTTKHSKAKTVCIFLGIYCI